VNGKSRERNQNRKDVQHPQAIGRNAGCVNRRVAPHFAPPVEDKRPGVVAAGARFKGAPVRAWRLQRAPAMMPLELA
jgi:hypothetical protein